MSPRTHTRSRSVVLALAGTVLIGGGLLAAAPANAAAAAPKLSISGSHTLTSGDSRTFTATGPTAARGATIKLQRASGKKWTTLVSKTANKTGDATITLRVTGVGSQKYRVAFSKTKYFKAASSKSVTLSLNKWFYLSDMDPVAYGSLGEAAGTITIGGKAYLHSVRVPFADEWGNDGYATFTLGYHCTQFAATVGINDDDSVPVPATNTVFLDDTAVVTNSTSTGQAAAVSTDVTGTFRIKLDSAWDHSTSTKHASGEVGWGNAAVLCSANPVPSSN